MTVLRQVETMPKSHQSPALYVAFGLPGAGKTFAAYVFERFGFTVHDGDDDLPADMRGMMTFPPTCAPPSKPPNP